MKLDRYSSEKGIPTVPMCVKSVISLNFNGSFLIINTPAKSYVYSAVSGRAKENGKFDYSVVRQKSVKEGSIPAGQYWILPSQLWTNHWYSLASSAAWGNHRITIHVYPGTNTYGRGGFFIHGGTHFGSAGCINLNAGMEKFIKDLQAILGKDSDCYIPLSIRY